VKFVQLPDPAPTSQSAADALCVPLSNVVKSLIFFCDDHPVVVLVGGDRRVDEGKLRQESGSQDVRRANPTQAREVSGFAVGAIPPFGHSTEMRILVDARVMAEGVLYASAGAFKIMMMLTPPLLARLPNVEVVDIAIS
jgi:prolyl-tRNA editing enzyme YbaK/EbsC (Cys-tRNA(Pro) deacylase)